jgi:hypothetical protein
VIIKDEHLLAEFRAKTDCERCKRWCPGELDVHHVFARGMGGGKRLDVRINLLGLCRWCHHDFHSGRISRRELLDLVACREQRRPGSIVTEIYRLRRQPKGPVDGNRRIKR